MHDLGFDPSNLEAKKENTGMEYNLAQFSWQVHPHKIHLSFLSHFLLRDFSSTQISNQYPQH